jgi:hypothetical protein
MAKVTIAGNIYVVTSDVAMADLETAKKYRPSALTLTDEETKETYFKVGVGTGTSSLNDHGISFGGVTNDDKKLATATLPIPGEAIDNQSAKEYVLDKAGLALNNLKKVEEGITAALKDIKAERENIATNIKVSV